MARVRGSVLLHLRSAESVAAIQGMRRVRPSQSRIHLAPAFAGAGFSWRALLRNRTKPSVDDTRKAAPCLGLRLLYRPPKSARKLSFLRFFGGGRPWRDVGP